MDLNLYNPDYQKDINKLVELYQEMGQNALSLLNTLEMTELTQEQTDRSLRELDKLYGDIIGQIDKEIDRILPTVAEGALIAFFLSLEIQTTTITESIRRRAVESLKHDVHQYLVERMSRDFKNDTRIIFGNQRKNIQSLLERMVGTSIRHKYSSNPLSHIEVNRLKEQFKEEIKRSVGTGYIDKSGRVWKPETYSEVVSSTKIMETFNQTLINEGVLNGYQYGRIMGPPAKDECNRFIGRVIKLDESTPGSMPSYESLRFSKMIFHPHCRHWVVPIENSEAGF